MWLSLFFSMVADIADHLEEAEGAWDESEREDALGCAEEHALKALPVLLEAVGPGPGAGYPEPSECRAMAEEVWRQLGARPGDEEWSHARNLVKAL